MKKIALTLACVIAATSLAAETTYSEISVSNEETTSVHGSLPGGDHSRWTTDEGVTAYTDWVAGETTTTETTTGNTTTTTVVTEQTREASRTDEALNPAGRSVGTDRFNPTTTWTETQTVTIVTTTKTNGGNPCGANCCAAEGGNGTDNEGKNKKN